MGVRSEVGFIPPLDGMRGIAVLWVMLFHFTALRGGVVDPWIEALARVPLLDAVVRNGYLGVDLFFLISGFLLTMPWLLRARAGEPPPSARRFYGRRIHRIVPAYYVQLLVLFVVVLPIMKGGLDYWKRDMYVVGANVFAHATFLHTFSPLTSASMSVNGALWTLALEMQYYLLLPLLAPLIIRAPATATVAAFIVAIAWQYAARHGLDALVAWEVARGHRWGWPEANVRQLLVTQLPSYVGHFALGTLLGGAWLAWRERGLGERRFPLAFAAAAVALGALLAYLGTGIAIWGEQTFLLSTACLGVLLFCAVAGRGLVSRALLSRGPLAFMGRISYSAYLYHLLVLVVLLKYAPALPAALAFPLFLAATIALSWLSWRFIEQPFLMNGVRLQLS
jgi:peptidoglycan/LPS O-acetylase OafA/YrhL